MKTLIPSDGKRENVITPVITGDFNYGDSFYTIRKHPENEFEFCCPQIETVLGYTPEEISSDILHGKIHPADRSFYEKYMQITANFFSVLPPEKKLKYKVRCDFRMMHIQGHNVRVVKQTIITRRQLHQTDLQIFEIYTDITHLKTTGDMTLSFIGMEGEPSLHNVHLTNLPDLAQLTKRENEILNLISQDQTSGEIAKTLNISKHTVNNHRKNILRKTGSRDIKGLSSQREL